ncbi:MAG: cobalamin-dependent protein [Planctomycetota bacterium]
MQTVLLINPGSVNRYIHQAGGWTDSVFVWLIQRFWDSRFSLQPHGRCTTMPPVTLMAIGRLFEQRGWRTILVDEQVERVDFSLEPDLVCITATTTQYDRAAYISSYFRDKGVTTVIGGTHATALPHDCGNDFDAVCVGEAENVIDDMLRDFCAGELQGTYRSGEPVSMEDVPFFRPGFHSGRHLPFHPVAFSRGCPYGCDFCSIRTAQGTSHRTRSIQSVVEHIKRSGEKSIWFTDAALTGNRERARRLFEALIPLDINWLSSVPFDVCMDESMVDLMAESGCWLVSVGFETLNEAYLQDVG